MKLDELKEVIEGQISSENKASEIYDYFVLLRYRYPNFSVHLEVSARELTSMLFRASLDSETLEMAILAAASLILNTKDGASGLIMAAKKGGAE